MNAWRAKVPLASLQTCPVMMSSCFTIRFEAHIPNPDRVPEVEAATAMIIAHPITTKTPITRAFFVVRKGFLFCRAAFDWSVIEAKKSNPNDMVMRAKKPDPYTAAFARFWAALKKMS